MKTKINAEIIALSPIFVGGDVSGCIRLPYMIHVPADIEKIKIDREKLEMFIHCLGAIYRNCDHSMSGKRSFTEIFRDRVFVSLCCNNLSEFFTAIRNKLNMTTYTAYQYVVKFVMGLNDKEHRFLLQWGRNNIDMFVAAAIYKTENFNFNEDFVIDNSFLEIETDYQAPVIPGNTIRGIMRDLLMDYVIQKVYKENPHKCLTARQYHTLFSGGMLNQSTGFVNIESKVKFREMMPFLSILGCMKGNEDLRGKMNVNFAKLRCKEFDSELTRSGYSYLKEYFATRKDDYEGVVTEKELKELGGAVQMKYSMLCIEKDSIFDWSIEAWDLTDLERAFFDLMLSLLIANGNIGGLGRAGFGKVYINLKDYTLDSTICDSWLEKNKKEIINCLNDI